MQQHSSSAIASPISKQLTEDQVYSSDDYIDEDNGDIQNDFKKVQKISAATEMKSPEKIIQETETEEEKEIQTMAEKMNEWCSALRTEVMNNLFDLKKRSVQKLNELHQRNNDDRDDLLYQHKLKEEKLRDSIAKRDYYLARFKTLTFRMADQISHARRVEREKTLLRNILGKWKEYTETKKMKKNLGTMLLRNYRRNQARKILQGWYMWILNAKQNTTERIWQNRLDNEKAEMRNDYEMKIEKLKEEILKLNQALEREQNDKLVLQENLKKALMRGVCAMNNKFLEIIKDTNIKPTQSFNVQQELEDVLNEDQDESEFIQAMQSQQPPIPRPYPNYSPDTHTYVPQPQVQSYLANQQQGTTTRFVASP
ncbi:hypothetical protein C9374_010266 [Naegleria lovaniensis]|uniref:Centrosomal protein POC5 n=1 Tax=Naegleria lovaniensis TaxID=51637 RepID=A0AA88GG03_NAELO|nr:uncharacterized protein C9374_010266 [Naegleria lovaniensis]KAG2374892.1 hypothetical protein C9374_010266 [Naegleria lovaniensis]